MSVVDITVDHCHLHVEMGGVMGKDIFGGLLFWGIAFIALALVWNSLGPYSTVEVRGKKIVSVPATTYVTSRGGAAFAPARDEYRLTVERQGQTFDVPVTKREWRRANVGDAIAIPRGVIHTEIIWLTPSC